MKGWLIIPVNYKGEQMEFRGKLLKGKGRYGYKIKVKVDGGEVVFEEENDGRYWPKVFVAEDGEGINGEVVEAISGVMERAMNER